MSDVPDTSAEQPEAPRRPGGRARLAKRIGLGLLALIAALVATGVVLYMFGSMETPSPQVRAAYESQVRRGLAQPVAERFHIPIPGCRCHSDDPVLQMQHADRRIRECSSCHGG